MADRRVASRYAKSLIELAEEKGILEEVNHDMQLFLEVCEENRMFKLAIKNPIIKNDKKLSILKGIFGTRVSKLTLLFLELISKKNREAMLPEVAEEFHKQYNQLKGVVSAEIVTTFPLDDALRTEFKALVKSRFNKEAELTEIIDESLIGGFVLTVGDKQINESLSNKLKELQYDFTHAHKAFKKVI